MVYYGVPSKGCERCRKRKIKCDLEKPGCQKCAKSHVECPGYRRLDTVLFRDESNRTIRSARMREQMTVFSASRMITACPKPKLQDGTVSKSSCALQAPYPPKTQYMLSPSFTELGANFFFAKYSFKEHPFCSEFETWLMQSYTDDRPSNALRAIIEAIGMAGLSNIFQASEAASEAKARYHEALAAMTRHLQDPEEATEDTTMMVAILLGTFETVNLFSLDRHCYWEAHIRGATTLLDLRGADQFTRERGAQLYVLIRSQILLACTQQGIAVPPALVQSTCNFEFSGIRQKWQERHRASPGSICEISFRVVNLRAAIKQGEITDPEIIHDRASEIDDDLKTWEACVPSSWKYDIIESIDSVGASPCFAEARHSYPKIWIAEVWNNWRTLRILVNQIILQNEDCSVSPNEERRASALQAIRQLSTDICISTPSFADSPRILSLLRPLYVVCLEGRNSRDVLDFAVEKLRHIDMSHGIRHAGFLADIVSKQLHEPPKTGIPTNIVFSSLLLPLC